MRTKLIYSIILCLMAAGLPACSEQNDIIGSSDFTQDPIMVLHVELRVNKSEAGIIVLNANQSVKPIQGVASGTTLSEKTGNTFRCEIRDFQNNLLFSRQSDFRFDFKNEKQGMDGIVKFSINLPVNAFRVTVSSKSDEGVWKEVYDEVVLKK